MPPTSRTKAEAMERPEPGERWRGEHEERLVRDYEWGSVSYEMVKVRTGVTYSRRCRIGSFRRWCAGADFIGGADA